MKKIVFLLFLSLGIMGSMGAQGFCDDKPENLTSNIYFGINMSWDIPNLFSDRRDPGGPVGFRLPFMIQVEYTETFNGLTFSRVEAYKETIPIELDGTFKYTAPLQYRYHTLRYRVRSIFDPCQPWSDWHVID